MKPMLRLVAVLFSILVSASVLQSQVATGTYPYGTFDNQGFDTINVGNLNVHFAVPVLNKAGRGLPFYYNLSYDSSVWSPSSVSGIPTWTPAPAFGWRGDTEISSGYISYSETTGVGSCTGSTGHYTYTIITQEAYHDSFGTIHIFPGYWKVVPSCPGGPQYVDTLGGR